MPRVSPARIRRILADADMRRSKEQPAAHQQRKGKALEELVCEILERVPGVEVALKNIKNVAGTQEVDITFWNHKLPDGFYHLDTPFLVECKNWATPVPAQVIINFSHILSQRACRDGILVACGGITGIPGSLSEAYYEVAAALARGQRILVINRVEQESFSHTDDIVELLKIKMLELASLSTLR
jgi:restriction endonuclease